MRICKNCNIICEDDHIYCSSCGCQTTEFVPNPVPPAAPTEQVSAVSVESFPVQTSVPVAAKVMSFIGLGLGIFGLAFGTLALILAFSAFDLYTYDTFGVIAIVYAFFAFGGSISGKLLSAKAMENGCFSNACTVGHTLSTIGFVLNIATSGVAFLAIISMA